MPLRSAVRSPKVFDGLTSLVRTVQSGLLKAHEAHHHLRSGDRLALFYFVGFVLECQLASAIIDRRLLVANFLSVECHRITFQKQSRPGYLHYRPARAAHSLTCQILPKMALASFLATGSHWTLIPIQNF